MKIKGVRGGAQRGTPIEYSPAEKFPLAVKDAVIKAAPQGEQWWAEDEKDGKLILTQGVSLTKSSFQNQGPRQDKKAFANNSYSAEGKVRIRKFDVAKDKLRPCFSKKFKIRFQDCCDNMGQPDLEITEFELT